MGQDGSGPVGGVEVLGATAVVRNARRRKVIEDPWLRRMLMEKVPGER